MYAHHDQHGRDIWAYLSRGKPDDNLSLSGKRANSVRAWLVAHGIAASRLTAHGYGGTQPSVRNDTAGDRARNRRIELKKPNCK